MNKEIIVIQGDAADIESWHALIRSSDILFKPHTLIDLTLSRDRINMNYEYLKQPTADSGQQKI